MILHIRKCVALANEILKLSSVFTNFLTIYKIHKMGDILQGMGGKGVGVKLGGDEDCSRPGV